MKLTAVTAKQSTSMNLNDLQNRVQMNTKISVRNYDCEKNKIAKHCWETNHSFNWDQKAGKFLGRSKKSYFL